jgi:hypothetical protein
VSVAEAEVPVGNKEAAPGAGTLAESARGSLRDSGVDLGRQGDRIRGVGGGSVLPGKWAQRAAVATSLTGGAV